MDVARINFCRTNFLGLALVMAFATAGCQMPMEENNSTEFRQGAPGCDVAAIPNQFIVHWKDGSVSVEKARDRKTFKNQFMQENSGEIEYAEHDYIVSVPEEPQADFSTQAMADEYWGQNKIEAPAAWNAGNKGQGVIVAVIDSGAEVTHSQLRNQLAINAGEIAGNNKDDDGNGYVDDVAGFDFFSRSGAVTDGSGHGTHVSGIILAEHGTGLVKGVAPLAKLLPLRFMDDNGAGSVSGAVEAIQYAVDRGAKVINASWGGSMCSSSLREAIADLQNKGVLFVAAAGNSGANMDWESQREYPAAFTSSAQITVGSTTVDDIRSYFSNFSWNFVHLMAPGSSIYSLYKGNSTRVLSGTSMAAPFVSGAAAVLWGYRPTATAAQIRQAIFAGVDKDPSEPNGTLPSQTGGRLNLRKSIQQLSSVLP
jgi:subtilisin family serine protease